MGRKGKLSAPIAAVGLLLGLLQPTVGAATKNVKLGEQTYTPATVQVKVGDIVRWTRAQGAGGQHNIHQTSDIFKSGQPTFDKIDYKRTFSAGSFPYRCDFHGDLGMKGTVKVPVKITLGENGLPTVQWATSSSNTGTKHDVQYKIGAGPWTDWLANNGNIKSVFGDGSEPDLLDGETYRFRARSQKVDGQESGYSPPKKYVH